MRPVIDLFVGFAYRLVEEIRRYRYRVRMRHLVADGLVLGKNVTIADSAYVDSGYPYLIRIGDNCSIASGVRLLAHDATPFKFTGGHTRLGKIEIKDNCFIGEQSIILPGVTIGPNASVAAGSLVNRDVPPNACVAGVPARMYGKFDAFIERHQQQLSERTVFEYAQLCQNSDEQLRKAVWEAVQDGAAYVKGSVENYPHTLNPDRRESES